MITEHETKCYVCGDVSMQKTYYSGNFCGISPDPTTGDLDKRCSQEKLETYVQHCPHCGYCFQFIDNEDVPQYSLEKIKEIIETDEYRKQLDNSDYPALVNHYLCARMLVPSHALLRYGLAIHAAWVCDDHNSPKATECRNKAIESLEGWTTDIEKNLVYIDLLRRAGRFEEATEFIKNNESISILKFQEYLISQKDAGRYNKKDLPKEQESK